MFTTFSGTGGEENREGWGKGVKVGVGVGEEVRDKIHTGWGHLSHITPKPCSKQLVEGNNKIISRT